jgi:hypothetical protein
MKDDQGIRRVHSSADDDETDVTRASTPADRATDVTRDSSDTTDEQQVNEAGLFGPGAGIGSIIAGPLGGVSGGVVDHLRQQHDQKTEAAPQAPGGTTTTPASPGTDALAQAQANQRALEEAQRQRQAQDQLTANQRTLEEAQRADEQKRAGQAERRRKRHDAYQQRMAEQDTERDTNRQEAEQQRQQLEESHRQRGEMGYVSGDSAASDDSGSSSSS